MKTISDILHEHPFFDNIPTQYVEFIAGCSKNAHFEANQLIATMGSSANIFYLIREGTISLTIDRAPNRPFIYKTLNSGDIVGLNWLIPPYRWTESATTVSTVKAIAIDGSCLKNKCENDPLLGYLLMKKIVSILVQREDEFRLHLLDVYK
ncbi:MAG: cyclic nucleotide-binding domain-containing protein [Chlamydiae bacterium]|nr:cyclic nucleotide-binding domain-containing protein [Chlamydiota bacterium]